MYRTPKKISTILFDLGTLIDRYSLSSLSTLKHIFKTHIDQNIGSLEICVDMGKCKRDHIRQILFKNGATFYSLHNRSPTEADVDTIFRAYVPIHFNTIKQNCNILPQTYETIERFKKTHKIGATSSFPKYITNTINYELFDRGINLDSIVASDEVFNTRPYPSMVYKNMDILSVKTPRDIVKISNTEEGILEGRNAGCWTIGVSNYSSLLGIHSLCEEASISEEKMRERIRFAANKLKRTGAHAVVENLNDIDNVIDTFNTKLNL